MQYRDSQLGLNGLVGDTLGDELKAYHHHLFQDCYAWAGEFRDVDITKENFLTGEQSVFAPWATIESRLQDLDPYLTGLEDSNFEEKLEILGYIHSELNEIHPFRESNGRATRVFMEKLAARYDIKVDWKDSEAAQMIAAGASMNGEELDSTPWRYLYSQISTVATWDDEENTMDFYDALEYDQHEFEQGQSLVNALGLSTFDPGLEHMTTPNKTTDLEVDNVASYSQAEEDSDLEL